MILLGTYRTIKCVLPSCHYMIHNLLKPVLQQIIGGGIAMTLIYIAGGYGVIGSALSILLSIERILGWDGSPPAPGGFYLSETLVHADAAMSRIEQFGIQIFREEREGEFL